MGQAVVFMTVDWVEAVEFFQVRTGHYQRRNQIDGFPRNDVSVCVEARDFEVPYQLGQESASSEGSP